jgi:hypothetical protein
MSPELFSILSRRRSEMRGEPRAPHRWYRPTGWNFHPLDNAMTTAIAPEGMLRFLDAVGHAPRWVDIASLQGDDAAK